MPYKMSKIQVSAKMKIPHDKLEEFKQQGNGVYQASKRERDWNSTI